MSFIFETRRINRSNKLYSNLNRFIMNHFCRFLNLARVLLYVVEQKEQAPRSRKNLK